MREPLLRSLLASFCLLVPGFLVSSWLQEAEYRLNETEPLTREEVLIASVAEEDYCTSQLRSIVRRVATSCGLISDGGRGCRSMEAKQVVNEVGASASYLVWVKHANATSPIIGRMSPCV